MRPIRHLLLLSFVFIGLSQTASAQGVLNGIRQKAKSKVSQRADEKVDAAMDKTLDEAENAAKGNGGKEASKSDKTANKDASGKTAKEKTPAPQADKRPDTTDRPPATAGANAAANAAFKTYQNYDFVPGDKILFEDHFTDDADGEFATHWELKSGQAVLNKQEGELALFLTDGNYAVVSPRMKTEKYLAEPYTVEYDMYYLPGSYGMRIQFYTYDKQLGFEREGSLLVNSNEVTFNGATDGAVQLTKALPAELTESFENKWHHVAVAVKNHQMKIYVDQYRVLVVPDTKEDYYKVSLASIGDEKTPPMFRNVRIASGGGMNLIGKKFTDAKIVTHGINFDVDKATIRPESMGTLNMIVGVMKENPELKFEVGGHTDNSGTSAHNLTLSQQRAEAVKAQLVKMGIDAGRLTTKGYGDAKPLSENSTLEGKANNRRVEFVKL